MPSKLQLLPADSAERVKELPDRVASLDGLAALWLFGSFVRGDTTPISDVDVAYLPHRSLTGEALDRFETDLYGRVAGTLHSDEFTFVHLGRAPDYFAWQVLTEGRLLACRDAEAVASLAEGVYGRAPDARWLRGVGNADFLKRFGMSEPSIDRNRVIEFLRLLSEDLRVLREKSRLPKEQYLGDPDVRAVVERRLQTATESCLNIGNHLIARLGFRAPQDYAEVFRILEEAAVLPPDVSRRMVDMAQFRNLLVHVYWGLDHGRMYDSLSARLSALDAFAQRMAQWLAERAH